MKHLKLLDTAAAKAAGFRPLTIGYQLPQERPMLDNVLADMRRGNINHCLVQSNVGVSVWRGGIATVQSFRTATIGACTQGEGKDNATCRVGQKRRHAAALQSRTAQRSVPTQTKTGRCSATSLPTKGKRS